MNKILESKYGLLIFSLLSGAAYFVLVMMLISNINYSYLLGIFFFPAVICGAALCVFKSVKNFIENEEIEKAKRIITIHIAVITVAVINTIIWIIA